MSNKAVEITKVLLAQEMVKMDLTPNVERMVFRGGQDPGGWSNQAALVCIIHEGTDIPNEYNHRDPFTWWDQLGNQLSKLLGERVYFEWINNCVAALYKV